MNEQLTQVAPDEQASEKETFRVFWTDAKHLEPQMVRLRFYSKQRAWTFAQELAQGSPHTTIWVEQQPDAAPDDVSTFALKLWARLNERRCHLIERNHAGVASDAERIELAQLQMLADECIHTFAPLPIAEMEAYMKSQGIDALAADELAQASRKPTRGELRVVRELNEHTRKLHGIVEAADKARLEAEAQLAEAQRERDAYLDAINRTNSNILVAVVRGTVKRAEKAEAENARLRAALEAVEWRASGAHFVCLWCGGLKRYAGHKPDCARQLALNPRGEGEE